VELRLYPYERERESPVPPPPPDSLYGPAWGDGPYEWWGTRLPLRLAYGWVKGTGPGATNGTGTTHTMAFTGSVGTDSRIMVIAENNENTGTGTGGQINVSTSSGTAVMGTWRQVIQSANFAAGSFSCLAAIWTCHVVTAGTLTVAVKGGNAANTWQISACADEYTGTNTSDTTSCIDASATSAWNPGTFNVSASAAASGELIYGGYASDGANNTITAGSGYALREYTGATNISEAGSEDKASTTGSQTVTWTGASSADIVTLIAIVKLAGGTTFTQTVSLATSPSLKIVKRISHTVPLTTTASVKLVKQVAHTVPLTTTAKVTLTKRISHTVPLSTPARVTITKRIAHTIPLTTTAKVTVSASKVVLQSVTITTAPHWRVTTAFIPAPPPSLGLFRPPGRKGRRFDWYAWRARAIATWLDRLG
jgi:hypothetical protein